MGHLPVMLSEVVYYLGDVRDGVIIDGTLGQGGHSEAILTELPETVTVVGTDRDAAAVSAASHRLSRFESRFKGVHCSYSDSHVWGPICDGKPVRGFLVDLGLSSVQLDDLNRGFSFSDSTLDMRFDTSQPSPSAADLVNTLPEQDLANLIYRFGEEKASRRIARAIVRRRNRQLFSSAVDLSQVVAGSYPSRHLKIHPATRTFQALRIAVNRELEIVHEGLEAAQKWLTSGGRLIAISFHSLEDRIVKQFLKDRSGRCLCPPGLPVCACNNRPVFNILTRQPVTASTSEIELNPRSRSAKLRCAERVDIKE